MCDGGVEPDRIEESYPSFDPNVVRSQVQVGDEVVVFQHVRYARRAQISYCVACQIHVAENWLLKHTESGPPHITLDG